MGFFAKNKRKLLAIFAAGLMVAFMLPSQFGQGSSGADFEVGKLDGKAVRYSEVRAARAQFDRLRQYPAKSMNPFERPVSIVQRGLPEQVFLGAQQHEEYWFLLVREAQQMGVAVTNDRVEEFLRNNVELRPTMTADEEYVLRRDVRDFLTVQAGAFRSMGVIKVTEPLRQRSMAQEFQELTVKLVEFPVGEFRSKVGEPTPQQIESHFNAFGNKDPDVADATNKFGFGYRQPNRVKFQYIELRRADLMSAVKASMSDYDWDVAARRHYRQNASSYVSTSQPATTQGATTRAAAGPTTQPFEAVRTEILETLRDEAVRKLEQQVLGKVQQTLMADYTAWKAANNGAGATSKPSSVGPAYGTYEYLQALAGSIQKQFGVLPVVAAVNEFTATRELGKVPAIGGASFQVTVQTPQGPMPQAVPVGSFFDQGVEAFAAADQKERALKAWQPSPPLRDVEGNVYVARVTDTAGARMPADVKEVAARVSEDLKKAAAYEMARQAAVGIATAAEKDGIESAALAAARKVTTAGPFGVQGGPVVPGLELLGDQQLAAQFISQAVELVRTDPKAAHAVKVVELPRAGRVFVAELVKAQPAWPPGQAYLAEAEVEQEVGRRMVGPFVQGWFEYANVVARTGWTSDAAKGDVGVGSGRPAPERDKVPVAPRPF